MNFSPYLSERKNVADFHFIMQTKAGKLYVYINSKGFVNFAWKWNG